MIQAPRETAAERRKSSRWHRLDCIFSHLPVVAVFASLAAAASVGFATYQAGNQEHKAAIRFICACWTVLPAVYFFFEFHWARATQTGREFRRVKESQKTAQKVWAGIVVALTVIYLKP